MKERTNKPMKKQRMGKKRSGLRVWGIFLLGIVCIGAFILFLSPWIEHRVPALAKVARISKEMGIAPDAYFYAETEISYDSERYVRESLELKAPDQTGMTLPVAASILLSLFILWLGYKLLPP